jgi:hypothetical protein
MAEIVEAYRKIGDPEDRFDIEFWQSQGAQAIFRAALELVLDSQRLRNGHADEPRLQRTIESFQRL